MLNESRGKFLISYTTSHTRKTTLENFFIKLNAQNNSPVWMFFGSGGPDVFLSFSLPSPDLILAINSS